MTPLRLLVWAGIFKPRHNGPNECGANPCEIPGCGTPAGRCCRHCPVAYRAVWPR